MIVGIFLKAIIGRKKKQSRHRNLKETCLCLVTIDRMNITLCWGNVHQPVWPAVVAPLPVKSDGLPCLYNCLHPPTSLYYISQVPTTNNNLPGLLCHKEVERSPHS